MNATLADGSDDFQPFNQSPNHDVFIISIILAIVNLTIIASVSIIIAHISIKYINQQIHNQFISNRPHKFVFVYSCISDWSIHAGMLWWIIKASIGFYICINSYPYDCDSSFQTFVLLWWCYFLLYGVCNSFVFFNDANTCYIAPGDSLAVCAARDCLLCCNCDKCDNCHPFSLADSDKYIQREFWIDKYIHGWLFYFLLNFMFYGVWFIFGISHYILFDYMGDFSIKWYDFYPVLILLAIKITLQIHYTLLGKKHNIYVNVSESTSAPTNKPKEEETEVIETKDETEIVKPVNEVQKWLETDVKLPEYYNIFIKSGFDSLEMMKEITELSYLEHIGITNKAHQIKLINQIKKLQTINDSKEEVRKTTDHDIYPDNNTAHNDTEILIQMDSMEVQ